MAKKKPVLEDASTLSLADRINKEIRKKYGDGILISGEDYCQQTKHKISLSPCLDTIAGGGIEEGSFVGITGHYRTGKTALALNLVANTHLPENGDRVCYWIKAEGRLDRKHLRDIPHLKGYSPHFNIVQSEKGEILTAEEKLNIARDVIENIPGSVVVIDSLSALCDANEKNEGIGYQSRGGGNKLISQFVRLTEEVVPVNNNIVIGIYHLIGNSSGMGSMYSEKTARAWKYQENYSLRTRSCKFWEAGGERIGLEVGWLCSHCQGAAGGGTCTSWIRFGVGLDRVYENLELASNLGIVHKSGAWYSFPWIDETNPPKVQGMENAWKWMRDNPEKAVELNDKVKQALGQ